MLFARSGSNYKRERGKVRYQASSWLDYAISTSQFLQIQGDTGVQPEPILLKFADSQAAGTGQADFIWWRWNAILLMALDAAGGTDDYPEISGLMSHGWCSSPTAWHQIWFRRRQRFAKFAGEEPICR